MNTYLPSLQYFLEAYWNQMGDIVHGDLDGAADAFKQENSDQITGLAVDLLQAVRIGIIKPSMEWNLEVDEFWSRFDRLIDENDASRIISRLKY